MSQHIHDNTPMVVRISGTTAITLYEAARRALLTDAKLNRQQSAEIQAAINSLEDSFNLALGRAAMELSRRRRRLGARFSRWLRTLLLGFTLSAVITWGGFSLLILILACAFADVDIGHLLGLH